MIKHHPTDAVLSQYACGTLPASVSVIVSAHCEMCPLCRSKLGTMEKIESQLVFDDSGEENADAGWQGDEAMAMIDAITADAASDCTALVEPRALNVMGTDLMLPTALGTVAVSAFRGIGKISRARLELEDGNLRTSLLHIEAGGEIPEHSHNGFEITLLLSGEFSDEMDTYRAGDFMWLDARHRHTPKTKTGCVCLTVVSDALIFQKGLSKMLNPIGRLIY